MTTLHSPVSGFTGPGPAGVQFVEGQAETDDPTVIAYARRHGYGIEEPTEPEPPKTPPKK